MPGISNGCYRDKNSCGIAEIGIIIGAWYFSPNGDGLNDYWHILELMKFSPQKQDLHL